MRLNKKRKIKTREDIIKQFNKLYPYELIIEYMDEKNKEVEWIDFWFEGNFDITKKDIKKYLKIMLKILHTILKLKEINCILNLNTLIIIKL